MTYKGIVFDFNGTLFWDSEKHLEAWRMFSKELRGTAFTDEEMLKYMFGRTNEDIIGYAIGKKPSPEMVKEYGEEKEAIYRDMCREDKDHLHLAPGAVELLDFLKENNIPMTIATMSEKTNVDFYVEVFNLEKWFDVSKIVYSDGTIPGKPQPDIFQIAMNRLGLNPEECIVVEDAISGLQAARNAKAGKVVAIASMESVDFYKNLPTVDEIISDFNGLDRNLFEVLSVK